MRRVLGAILAGGRSRRFGSDKAHAMLHGRPLIEWAVQGLASWTDCIVICGRENGLPDRPGPGIGPLGGLNAALHYARIKGFDAVLSAPCDAPYLPGKVLAQLVASASAAYLDAMPVVGFWPSEFCDALDQHMNGNDFSMRGWARHIDAISLKLDEPIAHVNTTSDLAELIDAHR